jgi:YfiH family protein
VCRGTRVGEGDPRTPALEEGVAFWRERAGDATILFLGKGTPREREAALPESIFSAKFARARLQQVHGATVREAGVGFCGEGDALVTATPGLALEIATADCLPVLLTGAGRIGAVHAGWRGIAAGVVPRALERLGEPRRLAARIGPGIGPCCYEVDEPVAAAVAAAAPGAEVIARRSERGRPVLDLALAVETQLRAAGVTDIRALDVCTRCHPGWLWSYRRDGAGAGRNLSLIFRDEEAAND